MTPSHTPCMLGLYLTAQISHFFLWLHTPLSICTTVSVCCYIFIPLTMWDSLRLHLREPCLSPQAGLYLPTVNNYCAYYSTIWTHVVFLDIAIKSDSDCQAVTRCLLVFTLCVLSLLPSLSLSLSVCHLSILESSKLWRNSTIRMTISNYLQVGFARCSYSSCGVALMQQNMSTSQTRLCLRHSSL